MSTGAEIRAKEKFEKEKQSMDYQHSLNIKLNKKSLYLSKIAILLALLSLIFCILTYFNITPENTNITQSIQAPRTAPANTNQ